MKKIGHVIRDDVSFELVSVTLLFNGESNPNSGVAHVQRSYLKLLERRFQRSHLQPRHSCNSSNQAAAAAATAASGGDFPLSKIDLTGTRCLEIIRDIQRMAFIVPKLES